MQYNDDEMTAHPEPGQIRKEFSISILFYFHRPGN